MSTYRIYFTQTASCGVTVEADEDEAGDVDVAHAAPDQS